VRSRSTEPPPSPCAGRGAPRRGARGRRAAWDRTTWPRRFQWRRAWRLSHTLLRALQSEVERGGARFAIVVVNGREEETARWRWQLDMNPAVRALRQDFDKPNRLLTRFLARRRIPYVPLLAPFRARFGAHGTPGFFLAADILWAAAGHALAARVVADALRAQGVVP
jgi:hypothetical protein